MRTQALPPSEFIARRERLMAQMGPEGVAVLVAPPRVPRSGDTEYPYRPDSDFFYLSGYEEPDAVLVISPGASHAEHQVRLFTHTADEFETLWMGESPAPAEVSRQTGISSVGSLEGAQEWIISQGKGRNGWVNEPAKAIVSKSFSKVKSITQFTDGMRMLKSEGEIGQIRRAIELTREGLARAAIRLGDGVAEYELEAALMERFVAGGGSGHAYEPIIAGGVRATTLHGTRNDKTLDKGDLVLLDVGAEYGWYAADVTRVWPVGGSFTDRQRDVYEAVLEVQQAAIARLEPGLGWRDHELAIVADIGRQLVRLGVLSASDLKSADANARIHQYYPHAGSHFLGLDVHDVGARNAMEPGMVLTVEPGIYLPDEAIGVRLEDDILITPQGRDNLSAAIPLHLTDVEKIIREHR